jgi:hypothetical protein
MIDALKHFAVVGLAFALVGGWIATLIVNTILGITLEALLHAAPTDYYWGSALLTVVSLALITLCIAIGNHSFHRWFADLRLGQGQLFVSAALFLIIVVVFVVPQLGQVMSAYASRTQHFYHHGSELLLMFSLPLARLAVLPTVYFISARRTLYATKCT